MANKINTVYDESQSQFPNKKASIIIVNKRKVESVTAHSVTGCFSALKDREVILRFDSEGSTVVVTIPKDIFIELIRSYEGKIISRLSREQIKVGAVQDQLIESMRKGIEYLQSIAGLEVHPTGWEMLCNEDNEDEEIDEEMLNALVAGTATIFISLYG